MTARVFTLLVRDAPKSNNAKGGGTGAHFQVAGKEKKRWEGLYLAELMVARVPRGMTHCKVDVTLHFRRRNHRDEENYRQGVMKPLADALQKGGYLPDDTRQEFEVGSFELREKSEPWPYPLLTGYTEVRLEAVYA